MKKKLTNNFCNHEYYTENACIYQLAPENQENNQKKIRKYLLNLFLKAYRATLSIPSERGPCNRWQWAENKEE